MQFRCQIQRLLPSVRVALRLNSRVFSKSEQIYKLDRPRLLVYVLNQVSGRQGELRKMINYALFFESIKL